MPTNDSAHRVRRALTVDELARIFAAVTAAANTRSVLNDAVAGIFNALLSDSGKTIADFDAEHRLNPSDYAIPTVQWQAIVTAITDRAAEWGTAVHLTFDLINLMPSTYDDPDVPAPTLTRVDRRPFVHVLHVTREATDVISACEAHLGAMAVYYGRQSQIYLDALHSWHRHLAGLFTMSMGADTHVSRDGDLSLFVTTASQFVFAIIFHGAWRHCTAQGCAVTIRDDGTWYPTHRDAPVGDHEHRPSYPLDAPQPGTWSFHS